MKMDTERSFGIVTGAGNGALYEQDGKLFDANYEEIEEAAPTRPVISAAPPDDAPPVKKGKKSPLDEQIAAQGA